MVWVHVPREITMLLQKPLLLPSLCLQKALQIQPQAAQDRAQSTDLSEYEELTVMVPLFGLCCGCYDSLKLRLGRVCDFVRVCLAPQGCLLLEARVGLESGNGIPVHNELNSKEQVCSVNIKHDWSLHTSSSGLTVYFSSRFASWQGSGSALKCPWCHVPRPAHWGQGR